MKVPEKVFFALMVIACIAMAGLNVYEHIASKQPKCAWCGEPMYGEQTQLGEYWICDRCWSELALQYGWYKECSSLKMGEIMEAIEARN